MEIVEEPSVKVHQNSVEQAIGEFRSYFETLDKSTKKILMNQQNNHQDLRPVDAELRDKLRLDYLRKEFGKRNCLSAYSMQEKIDMYGYFYALEQSFRRCYQAGLVQWNGHRVDGSLNGTATKLAS